MAKFRKKPVVIEAVQWDGSNKCADQIADMRTNMRTGFVISGSNIQIETLEGTMVAMPGDWVIAGVTGELYPCKDEIFKATYEEV